VTRERILGYYRNLTTGPDEGLVFFYGGHGALDKVKGHFLELQAGKGKPLLRSELRKAMEARKAGLVVLLTDCCSTPKRLPAVSRDAAASSESARTLHPTVRCLLFQARGTVDVTAATATASWSDNEQGGIFTRALCELLSADLKALDTDRDQFVSWREFFPRLRRGTESTFKQWRKEMRRRGLGDEIDATDQKPYAWALGGAVARPTPAAPEFVVVSLNNKSGEEVRYRYRWSNESAWKSGTLRPGGQAYHARRLGADSRGVVLEAKFDGMNSVVQLKPLRWTGKGQPGYSAGAKYDIELRR
jgi:hypothetical protein